MKNIKENPRFVTMPKVHPAQVDCLCNVPGCFYMKEIQLTQGKVALVDDEDFEYLNQWKWLAHSDGNNFYAEHHVLSYKIDGKKHNKSVKMHRLIMKPSSNMHIDHINRNGLDNRKENLRIVTHRENHHNRINSRKYIGVAAIKNGFAARIKICNRSMHIGFFKTEEDASKAYMEVFNYVNRAEHDNK